MAPDPYERVTSYYRQLEKTMRQLDSQVSRFMDAWDTLLEAGARINELLRPLVSQETAGISGLVAATSADLEEFLSISAASYDVLSAQMSATLDTGSYLDAVSMDIKQARRARQRALRRRNTDAEQASAEQILHKANRDLVEGCAQFERKRIGDWKALARTLALCQMQQAALVLPKAGLLERSSTVNEAEALAALADRVRDLPVGTDVCVEDVVGVRASASASGAGRSVKFRPDSNVAAYLRSQHTPATPLRNKASIDWGDEYDDEYDGEEGDYSDYVDYRDDWGAEAVSAGGRQKKARGDYDRGYSTDYDARASRGGSSGRGARTLSYSSGGTARGTASGYY